MLSKPVAGNIYVFHTMPANEFSASETGRWAAIKVLGIDRKMVVVAVLDGIWTESPSMKDVGGTSILRWRRSGQQAVFGVNVNWWSPSELSQLTFLENRPVSSEDAALAAQTMNFAPGSSFSTLRAANQAAEGAWRWAHDREAFSQEIERIQLKMAQDRAAQEERYRTRLSKLTWDQLLAETPFERWSPSPPFPPEDFTLAARQLIHQTCRKLEALGAKPRKADVRAVLKSCVQWFNDADQREVGRA